VHVRDVAAANVAALAATGHDDGEPGLRAYNVASGTPRTVGEMATALAAVFGGRSGGLAPVVTGAFRAGDVRHVVASPRRAERELGFAARVGFADGMAELAKAPLRA